MKSHWPRAFSVMNSTITPTARAARIRRTRRGCLFFSRKAFTPFQQEEQEEGAADNAHDRADGNFIRVIDDAPDDVASEHEARAENSHPGQGAAHVVADQQAHH